MTADAVGSLHPVSGDRVGVLALTDRNGVVESMHHGVAVALDAEGAVTASVGDIDTHVYPRSALKPFQATAMVELGLDLPDRLLALAAASHSGERHHLEGVREILSSHGLVERDLGNTPTRPSGAAARAEARLTGVGPSSIQQNCSGKHAAMLATCVVNQWPTGDYLEPEHPLQRAIIGSIERLGAEVAAVGVDGCGAPTHVLTLRACADALRRLVVEDSPVTRAMSAHPMMVGGTDRDVTAWTAAVPGLVAKEGAQGVMVVATADGRAAALKIADGSDAGRQAVTVQALRHLGVDVDGELAEVRDRVAVPAFGHGRPVGATTPVPWSDATR